MLHLTDYNNNNSKQGYQHSIDYTLLANQTFYPSPTQSPNLNSPTSLMFNDMQNQQQQSQETFQATSYNDWSLDGFYHFDSLNQENTFPSHQQNYDQQQNNNMIHTNIHSSPLSTSSTTFIPNYGLLSPPLPPSQTSTMIISNDIMMNQLNHQQELFFSLNQEQPELDSTTFLLKENDKKKSSLKKKPVPYANNLLNLNFNLSSSPSSSSSSASSSILSSPSTSSLLSSSKINETIEKKEKIELKNKRLSISSTSSTSLSTTTNHLKSNYQCDYPGCNKTFTRSYNLKSHKRAHTNERPYECNQCTKRFARQHDRDRHAKIHLGIKPFVCLFCLKTFARQDALSRHQKWSPTSSNNEYDYPICSTLKRKNRKKQAD